MKNTIRMSNGHILPLVRTRLDMELPLYSEKPLESAKDVVEFIAPYMANLTKEIAVLICFDLGLHPICVSFIAEGDQKSTDIPARDVLQIGLLANASYVAILHNHPTALSSTKALISSKPDVKCVDTIAKMCKLAGMELLDSIIVGTQFVNGRGVPAYYSMRERKTKQLQNINVDKYSKGAGWLVSEESLLEWNGNKKASHYWGVDLDTLEAHPSITACSQEELLQAIELVKSGALKKKMDEQRTDFSNTSQERLRYFEDKMKEISEGRKKSEELFQKINEIKQQYPEQNM